MYYRGVMEVMIVQSYFGVIFGRSSCWNYCVDLWLLKVEEFIFEDGFIVIVLNMNIDCISPDCCRGREMQGLIIHYFDIDCFFVVDEDGGFILVEVCVV